MHSRSAMVYAVTHCCMTSSELYTCMSISVRICTDGLKTFNVNIVTMFLAIFCNLFNCSDILKNHRSPF